MEIKKEALVLPTDNPKHSIWYKTCGVKAIIVTEAVWKMFNFKEESEVEIEPFTTNPMQLKVKIQK